MTISQNLSLAMSDVLALAGNAALADNIRAVGEFQDSLSTSITNLVEKYKLIRSTIYLLNRSLEITSGWRVDDDSIRNPSVRGHFYMVKGKLRVGIQGTRSDQGFDYPTIHSVEYQAPESDYYDSISDAEVVASVVTSVKNELGNNGFVICMSLIDMFKTLNTVDNIILFAMDDDAYAELVSSTNFEPRDETAKPV